MFMSVQLPLSRRDAIYTRLAHGQPVVAAAMAAEFDVSEDAIRRDLRALAAEGKCRRVYGGALPLSSASLPMAARIEQGADRKRALARAAAATIEPGEFLFLDSGSTKSRPREPAAGESRADPGHELARLRGRRHEARRPSAGGHRRRREHDGRGLRGRIRRRQRCTNEHRSMFRRRLRHLPDKGDQRLRPCRRHLQARAAEEEPEARVMATTEKFQEF